MQQSPVPVQVQSVGEQLVFLGGSHGWGPGKLTDAQVSAAAGFTFAARHDPASHLRHCGI